MKREWQIYTLSDPRTGNVRYVGKTHRAARRRYQYHLWTAAHGNRTYCARWIRSLLTLGLKPICAVIEQGKGKSWITAERQWIALYRNTSDLTNLTDGGEGSPGHTASPETRARMSVANTGKHHSLEARARMSAVSKGRKFSPETLAKLSAAGKRRKHSPETLAKMSLSHTGKYHSPEARAKMSAACKGRKFSPETLAKLAATQVGRRHSVETRARMSTAQQNRSPEIRRTWKPVICVETGQSFSSMRAAAKSLKAAMGAVRRAIKRHGRCRGYYFIFAENK